MKLLKYFISIIITTIIITIIIIIIIFFIIIIKNSSKNYNLFSHTGSRTRAAWVKTRNPNR